MLDCGMKFIHCHGCGDNVAMSVHWRACHCGRSGGQYVDQRTVTIRGDCGVFGVDNHVFMFGRGAAFAITEPSEWVVRR